MYPILKGLSLFIAWVLDFIVGMTPPTGDGHTLILVAVCPFSKWVEAGTCASTSSADAARWVHTNIVTSFGKPAVFRGIVGLSFRGRILGSIAKLTGLI